MDNKLRERFASANEPPRPPSQRQHRLVAMPASQVKIDELHQRLSEPKLTASFTPMGAVTRQVRTESDQRILAEIEAIRHRLALRRGALKEAFGRTQKSKRTRLLKR